MGEQVFETRIANNRPPDMDMDSGIYSIYESTGERLGRVGSGGVIVISSDNPRSLYARWDRVEVFKDHIELHERSGFQEPVRGQFEIELFNEAGGEIERRAVGGSIITLPRHIPVRVGLGLADPLIWFSRIKIERVWERRRDDHFPGYYVRTPCNRDVKVERPETELYWILGAMRDASIEPPERETPVVEEKAFETVFENKTDQPVKVFADSGRIFFAVGPKGSTLLESYAQWTMYSRYKRITFKKDGGIDLDENGKWKNPYPLSVELINLDGAPIEAVQLGGQSVNVVKGIPRFAEVHADEVDARYRSFTWRRIKIKEEDRSGLRPGYFEEHWEVRCVKEGRK